MSIQRWFSDSDGTMRRDPDGSWVDYDDHVAALAEVERRVSYPEWDNHEYERGRADERQQARQRVEAALAEVKAALNNYPRLTARDGAQEAENAVLRALAAGGDA